MADRQTPTLSSIFYPLRLPLHPFTLSAVHLVILSPAPAARQLVYAGYPGPIGASPARPLRAEAYSAVTSSSAARASASTTGGGVPSRRASAKRRNWPAKPSGSGVKPASAESIAACCSGVSPVNVQGSPELV